MENTRQSIAAGIAFGKLASEVASERMTFNHAEFNITRYFPALNDDEVHYVRERLLEWQAEQAISEETLLAEE